MSMPTNMTMAAEAVSPLDLLPIIRRSQALTESKFEEVRDKVLSGVYPREPVALAERLVKSQVLTEYQVSRLLKNKPASLIVGRYVILDRIGSGSMGRVYKARHLLMDRIVALKIIAPEYVASPRKVARFAREIRLIGRLDHPNVVRAFDADRVANVPYIAMEYVPGQNLSQRLQERGPLPPEEVVVYAAQAAQGLAHAHEQGIVHRDVKPSNLLLSRDRQLKILDFGLGILMETDHDESFATNDGIAVGTIDYMSPEQTCGHEIDGRSDIYSLGCAMYYLMTQRLLFPGSSTIERLASRAKGHLVPIAELHPEFPPRLVRVLERMLAAKPEERFQSATEASEALWDLSPRHCRPALIGRIAPEAPSTPSVPAASESLLSQTSEPIVPLNGHADVPRSESAGSQNLPPLPPLFRFLIFLAEQSLTTIVLGSLTVASLIFGAGFGLAMMLR